MSDKPLLTQALEAIDIADLIGGLCPESGAGVGIKRCKASWRGGDDQNVEFFVGDDGLTMYKDHREDISGNAHNWLVDAYDLDEAAATKFLIVRAGLSPDQMQSKKRLQSSSQAKTKSKIVKVFEYRDLEGNLISETVRYEPKNFVQRRRHPENPKQFVWGLSKGTYYQNSKTHWSKTEKDKNKTLATCELDAVQTVLYNLQQVDQAKKSGERIYVTEGEKDADSLIKLGLTATCNIGGGGNWTKQELATLKGCNVVLIADNDEIDHRTGTRKGEVVAYKLSTELMPKAKSLSNPVFMPDGIKDVSDWIADGGTKEQLEQLVQDAPVLPKPKDKRKEEQTLEQSSKKEEPEPAPKEKKEKEEKKPKKTPSELMITLLEQEGIELFNDGDNNSFVRIIINGSKQSFNIKDSSFRRFMIRTYWMKLQKSINDNGIKDAIAVLDAKAQFEGDTHATFNRTARHGNNIYIDLANEAQDIVEISAKGWKIIDSSTAPMTFVKSKGTGELPRPIQGGSLNELRAFVQTDDDLWALISSFLVGALKPEGPYPILNLIAEQGSGKSTTARIIKWLIDPSPKVGQLLRTAPRDDQALFIGAKNNHVLAFDNLSTIRPWLSDALCILSTGGSFVTRALYTDGEETSMEAMRPMILTGIGDLATRGDLLSRSLLVGLPRLESMTTEQELWEGLEGSRASILGGIFTAMSEGLKVQQAGQDHKPETRLADFELWAMACEKGLGVQPRGFLSAYRKSKENAAEVVLSASPLAGLLQKMLKQCHGHWQGTAQELLDGLIDVDRKQHQDSTGVVTGYTTRITNQKSFPKTPLILSKNLMQIAPALRDVGIEIEKFRGNDLNRKRYLRIEDTGQKKATISA